MDAVGAGPRWRRDTIASTLLFVVAIGLATRSSYRDEVWNLDVVLYLSAALSWTIDDPVKRHGLVYDEARAALPPRAFEDVTATSEYRRARRPCGHLPCLHDTSAWVRPAGGHRSGWHFAALR
jgi:hypothetical protein